MANSTRDGIIKSLEEQASTWPSLRVGQILVNAALANGWHTADIFYIDDEELLAALLRYREEVTDATQ